MFLLPCPASLSVKVSSVGLPLSRGESRIDDSPSNMWLGLMWAQFPCTVNKVPPLTDWETLTHLRVETLAAPR